jgi:uncharacterized protein
LPDCDTLPEVPMPSFKQRLHDDLTTAMRARDEVTRSTLRMMLSAITKAEVAGKEHVTLTHDQVVGLIRSEMRKRTEAAEIYEAAGREELARRERAEAGVLSAYLPAELDDDALAAVVAEEVRRAGEHAGAEGKMIGAIIKAVRVRVGMQADGARIADAVKRALAAKS